MPPTTLNSEEPHSSKRTAKICADSAIPAENTLQRCAKMEHRPLLENAAYSRIFH